MLDARLHRMGMSIVESWKRGMTGKVNLSRARIRQTQHLSVRANGDKSRATDGHRLGPRLAFILCPDVPVIQNDFGLFDSQERERQKAAHPLHEIPPRQRSRHTASRKNRENFENTVRLGLFPCSL